MNAELKLKIQKAIDKVVTGCADDNAWDGYIHDELSEQMANAAALVFDSSMAGQKFAEENRD